MIIRLDRLFVELYYDNCRTFKIVFEADNEKRFAIFDIKNENFFQFEFAKNVRQFLQKIFRNIDSISLFIFIFLKSFNVVKMIENPAKSIDIYIENWFEFC